MDERVPVETVDPVTVEILTGKLLATVDEMGIIMAKTSMSPIVYEVLDFACGICTPSGDLVAQSNGITLFTGTFATQVRALAERFANDMAPGDMFATNDPFSGGTHPNDVAIMRPIFHGDRLLGFAITVAHWLDIGGTVPGSLPVDATWLYQEGLRLPGVRVARNDELIDDIVRIIQENVRMPDLAMGDLRAQVATARVAERNLSRDRRRVRHLTKRSGEGLRLRLDAHNLWPSAAACIDHVAALDGPIFAIEEPTREGDLDGFRAVAEACSTKIILDESLWRPEQLGELPDADLWIANLRVSKMGGLIRTLEIADNAAERGIGLIVGAQVGETSLLTRAGLTVMAAYRRHLLASEGAFGTYLLQRDLTAPRLMFGDAGALDVGPFNFADRPGLGLHVNESDLRVLTEQ